MTVGQENRSVILTELHLHLLVFCSVNHLGLLIKPMVNRNFSYLLGGGDQAPVRVGSFFHETPSVPNTVPLGYFLGTCSILNLN